MWGEGKKWNTHFFVSEPVQWTQRVPVKSTSILMLDSEDSMSNYPTEGGSQYTYEKSRLIKKSVVDVGK